MKDINCATRKNISTRCISGAVLGQEGSSTGIGTSKTGCACACHQKGFTLAGLEGGNCFCDHGSSPDPRRCGAVPAANSSAVCDDGKTTPGEQGGYCAVVAFSFDCSSLACAPPPPPPPPWSRGPKGVEPRSAVAPSGRLVVVSGRDGLFAWSAHADKLVSGPWTEFNIAAHHNSYFGNSTTTTACGNESLAYPPDTVAGRHRMGATTGYMGIARLGDAVVVCYDLLLRCKDSTRVYCFRLLDA